MSRYIHRSYFGRFLRISAFGLAMVTVAGSARAQSAKATQSAKQTPSASNAPQTAEDKTFTLVGAGDIAGCGSALAGAEATAKLIEKIPGEVFASGDLAYEHGNAAEFHDCYGKTWGRFKDRTHPSLGNHEYGTPTSASGTSSL
jgi:acid phosphatase type 7